MDRSQTMLHKHRRFVEEYLIDLGHKAGQTMAHKARYLIVKRQWQVGGKTVGASRCKRLMGGYEPSRPLGLQRRRDIAWRGRGHCHGPGSVLKGPARGRII